MRLKNSQKQSGYVLVSVLITVLALSLLLTAFFSLAVRYYSKSSQDISVGLRDDVQNSFTVTESYTESETEENTGGNGNSGT